MASDSGIDVGLDVHGISLSVGSIGLGGRAVTKGYPVMTIAARIPARTLVSSFMSITSIGSDVAAVSIASVTEATSDHQLDQASDG